jgi:hypothetical protein
MTWDDEIVLKKKPWDDDDDEDDDEWDDEDWDEDGTKTRTKTTSDLEAFADLLFAASEGFV